MANTTASTSPKNSINLTGLLSDLRVLLLLFVSFRVMMIMVYQPLITDDVERGVGAQGDRLYHFQLSALTDEGDYPFDDWWTEFPPVWSFLTVGVYQLQGDNVTYENWSSALDIIVLAFDVGILLLIRAIGTQLYGKNTGMTLAWVYALCAAPMVFAFWNFETIVAFFLLLGVWLLIRKKHNQSAIAVALGALTKFTPALIFGALLRFRDSKVSARYIAIAVGGFALVYLPLFAQNAEMTAPSLTAQFNKASYQTVWAMIDDNYTTGNFGTVESHYDPESADELYGEPAVIPSFVRLAIAGAIGLFVFFRTKRFDDRGIVAFVGITLLIFFLQAQGWSPQWLVQIIPLILLVFPTRNGVLTVIVLSMAVFFEYPVLFVRTGDTDGVITGILQAPFIATILVRTAILVAVCVAFFGVLRQEPIPESE